jgi:hypothetical protein
MSEHGWQSLAVQGRRGAAVNAARASQGRILDLLVAHHIDANRAYRDRAIEELRTLISWSTWVDPSHGDLAIDTCTAEAAVAATVGLDWLYDDLSEADRLRVRKTIRKRVIDAYLQGVKNKAWWYESYQSWNAVINSACGLAGLALGDEDPKAERALGLARAGLERFFDALGREGGWDEGAGLWGQAMHHLLLFNEASTRLLDDQRIIHQRGMDVTGTFPVYFTPNGRAASFGEAPAVPLHGALYLLVRHLGVQEVAWWLDTYTFHDDLHTDGWSAAGLSLLFRPDELDTPVDPGLHCVKVFNEIGWVAIADQWPKPTMYVSAKTGDLSAFHSHRDMNALQLQVDGQMVLINPGPPDTEGTGPYQDAVGEPIRAADHNTLVIGQRDHALDAQGGIIDAVEETSYRWVACDAGQACGVDTRFVRHVVMILDPKTHQGRTVLILDEIFNAAEEPVDVFWHVASKPEVDEKQRRFAVAANGGAVHGSFISEPSARLHHRSWQRRRGSHHVLKFSAELTGHGLFAAAFARDQAEVEIELKTEDQIVVASVPGASVRFKRARHHLQLDRVDLS